MIRMLNTNAGLLKENGVNEPVEYLLVNDSPWAPVELPEESMEHLTVRVLENPENLGIHRSRIRGIQAARGELIAILDQDDEIVDSFLLSQYRALGNGDAVICNGWKEHKEGSSRIYRDKLKMSLVNCKLINLMAANQIVSPGQSLLRKAAIPAGWLEYPMLTNGSDDLYLWLLYLQKGIKFRLNFENLYIHKQVGDNLSNSLEKMCQSDMEMCNLLSEHKLLPEKDIRKRLRMCRFLQESGYQNRVSLCNLWKYPDVMLLKLFARFC